MKNKFKVLAAVAVLAMGSIALFLDWAGGSSVSNNAVVKMPADVLAAEAISVDLANASFQIEGNFSVKEKGGAKPPFLDQVFIAASVQRSNGPFADQTGVTIGDLSYGVLEETSGYLLRSKSEDKYVLLSTELAGKQGYVFGKLDSTEVSFYFQDNKRWASISVGGAGTEQLKKVLTALVTSWKWKD